MTDSHISEEKLPDLSREEVLSALFAQLVMQQSNMAMMLLGKVAHPETGQVVKDIEAAKFFIDQLEMLEVKTKGNLSKEEGALLKQSLMSLRLAFVGLEALPRQQTRQCPRHSQIRPSSVEEPSWQRTRKAARSSARNTEVHSGSVGRPL